MCYEGDTTTLDTFPLYQQMKNKVDLLFTSPPFALLRQKKYGNLNGEDYVRWFADLAPIFSHVLKPRGSIVIEMGNAWVKGKPAMSLHPLKALIEFVENGEFFLCQKFIWNNPARLPSPAQWINIERIRVKDAFTHIWWMSNGVKPKANNRNVLKEYSQSRPRSGDFRRQGTASGGSQTADSRAVNADNSPTAHYEPDRPHGEHGEEGA